jgi:pSer/pThr/pTyr-binding forkhead associated (FHA) protein
MGGGIDGARSAKQARISWYSKLKPALKRSDTFLVGATVTIGRGAGRDIVLDGDLVSDNHAHLEISDGKVLFQDLGSANGSFLNGRQRIA